MARMKSKPTDVPDTDAAEADPTAGHVHCGIGFPLVGIGASAGGLDPIKRLVPALPVDQGIAYVIIQHLDPAHVSHLQDLLQPLTSMPVVLVDGKSRVEPNTVYTVPSNRFVAIEHGTLVLRKQIKTAGRRLPIDFFFDSMGSTCEERAIGIVLSGTGSDGTQGTRSIRRAGGLVIAQDPEEAQFGDMPRSAINSGMVDFVLNIEQVPDRLRQYVRKAVPRAGGAPPEIPADEFAGILGQLITHTRSDFRTYKRSTILRRIYRRMGMRQVDSPAAYLDDLRRNPDEAVELRNDLLIGVTGFFREPDAFDELRTRVIAPLVEAKCPDDAVRIWVPGCATGEEAYSLSMLLHEELSRSGKRCAVQVFASDIDGGALERARAGVYSHESIRDVPEPLLGKYFTQVDGDYQIAKRIREPVVFSTQNLIADPPFSRLDLVSCRNVLIYLQPDIQKKIVALFAFALQPGGYLFLGKSDGIAGRDHLFELLSKESRIFKRRATARPHLTEFPIVNAAEQAGHPAGGRERGARLGALTLINQEVLLEHFSASVVLVNTRGRIAHLFGDAADYLHLPTGDADMDLLDMLRDRLALKVRPALQKVLAGADRVDLRRIPMKRGDKDVCVDITLRLVRPLGWSERLVAVVFQQTKPRLPVHPPAEQSEEHALVSDLEHELRVTKEELQSTYEEFETSNEELKAANEEVMSMNEELHSANEELETSKEELQSINEELTTVNSQLTDKLDELGSTNNDLANLLNATPVAAIFLDSDLRVKRFTPKATQMFNLIAADTGRPIQDLRQKFAGADVASDARIVLDQLQTLEHEVHSPAAWFLVRSSPYRTLDNRIEGVVVTFEDITRSRQAQTLQRRVLDGAAGPMAAVDRHGAVLAANEAFAALFGAHADELTDKPVTRIGRGQWDLPALREALSSYAARPVEIDAPTRDGPNTVRLRVEPIADGGEPFAWLLTIRP